MIEKDPDHGNATVVWTNTCDWALPSALCEGGWYTAACKRQNVECMQTSKNADWNIQQTFIILSSNNILDQNKSNLLQKQPKQIRRKLCINFQWSFYKVHWRFMCLSVIIETHTQSLFCSNCIDSQVFSNHIEYILT